MPQNNRIFKTIFIILTLLLLLPISTPASAAPVFTNKTTADGLGDNHIQGVYVSGNTVYAATISGLSISTDLGASFVNKTTVDGLGSNNVIGVYAVDNIVYAATADGLSISTDSGASFVTKTTSNGLGANKTNTVYASGNTVYAATDNGLGISTDGGDTFINKTTLDGLGNNLVYSVYHTDNITYVCTLGGLSISSDDITFINKTTADGLGSNVIYGVYTIGTTIYAATEGGLSKSTNGGGSFTNLTGSGQFAWVNGVYAVGNKIYGATLWDNGLAVSKDNGTSFAMYTTSDGLGSNSVYHVYESEGVVYAATGNGLSFASLYTTPAISGSLGSTGAGATLSYTDGAPMTATADDNGDYFFTVANDWSGTVTPSKAGFIFSPTDGTYNNIVSDQTGQNYVTSFSCTTVTEIPQSECDALVALYNSTDSANWVNNTDWLQTDTPCSWHGVTCAAGTNVTDLNMEWNNLSGTIPSELGSLANLTELDLSYNQLSGIIPTQLGSLTNLSKLYLYNNQLSGTIPAELGSLTNLSGLYLNNNQLSGTVPTELGSLTNLGVLVLSYNQLSGIIPAELGSLTNLWGLHLSSNQLSGIIPTELGSLTNLTGLGLSSNQLSGTIPTELGSLTNLTSLSLGDNQLTGSIPTELGSLTNLTSLSLGNNQLSGSIPTELGSLTNLTSLSLGNNQLTGSIPTQLGSLTNLSGLSLSVNQLDGSIPTQLGNLVNLNNLNLSFNQLNGSIPPELGNLINLSGLDLQSNQLSGEIPTSITNLVNLLYLTFDCQLTSSDQSVIDFINIRVPGWQTQCLPAITNVTPNFGPASGGTSVTLWGAKFTDASSVTFGGESASFTVNSDWQITATSPAHAGGLVDITVTTPNGIGTTTGAFTYSSSYTSCATISGIPETECNALVALYNSTDGANWTNNTNWLQTDTPCSWYGVTCGGTHVAQLNLLYNNLVGTLPTELGNLTNLTYLYLNNNQLTGSIPAGLGSLTQLQYLSLNGNQLSGEFPTSITNLTNLYSFEFDQCAGLTSNDSGVIAFLNNIAPDWNVCDQEISVWKVGSGAPIPNGDTTPSLVEGTDFEVVRINEENFYGFKVMNAGVKTNLQLTGNPIVQISGDPSFTVTYQPYPIVWAGSSWGNPFGIRFSPTSTGLHTATVSIASNDADENPYTFTIQGIGAKKDFYESDNDFSTAKTISPGVTQDHSIFPAGDHDYVKFTLTSPSSVVLETSGLNGYDTEIALYDASHNLIGYDNDGGNFMYSRLERTCGNSLPAGTYYLMTYIYEGVIPQYQLAFNTAPCVAISGKAGVAGATLKYTDVTLKTVTADASGNYSFTVPYNWSGTVTPSKTGYTFSPVNKAYVHVLANQTQNYTATAIRYTISGKAGTGGATLRYTDVTLKTVTADAYGNYSFTVPYNWSGTVTPSKTGYTFSPVNKAYVHVLANQTAQNYRATTSVTFYSNAAQDGWILESTETSNAGGTLNSAQTIFILGDDNLKKQYRSILSFTTSGLPDTAVITAATLKIRQYSVTGGATFSMFQGLLIDIFRGPFLGISTLQTGDFQSAAHKTGVGPFTAPAVGGWYAFNLTTSQAYINKAATNSGLTQFRLRFKLDDNNNAIANYITFFSGNAPAVARPQLIIQYYVP